MSELIGLSIEPGSLTATAGGETAQVIITVENRSRLVDHYQLQVEGLEPSWYDLPPTPVELLPGERGQVIISFHPPRTTETQAGSYPFSIRAVSQSNPLESSTLESTMGLLPFGASSLEMSPQRLQGGRGNVQLTIHNRSNAPAHLELQATDLEESLEYRFSPDTVTVPPGGDVTIGLALKSRKRALFGSAHEHPFRVLALEPGQAPEETSLVAEGTFTYIPLLAGFARALGATWRRLRPVLPLLLPLLAVALALAAVVKPPAAAGAAAPPSISLKVLPPAVGSSAQGLVLDYGLTGEGVTNTKALQSPASGGSPPQKTDQFTISASGPGGQDTGALDVAILGPPVIVRFLSSPPVVNKGDSTTLLWLIVGASKADINGTPIPADQLRQDQRKSPPLENDTMFTLTAGNSAGEVAAYLNVFVGVAPTPGPTSTPEPTSTAEPTSTPEPTATTAAATATPLPTGVPTATPTATPVPTATATSTPVPTSTPVCQGDETMSFNPAAPRVGDTVTITVTSSRQHTGVKLTGPGSPALTYAGTGGLGWQWQWQASVTAAGRQDYSFYVMDTVLCTTSYFIAAAPTAPTIDSFTATPNIITQKDTSTLSWQTSNATSVSIDPGIGTVAVDGTRGVAPGATTTYALTATGPGGTATASVTVTVVLPVSVQRFIFSKSCTGPSTETVRLTWLCSGGSDARVTLSRRLSTSLFGVVLVSNSTNLSGNYTDNPGLGTYIYMVTVQNAAGQTDNSSQTVQVLNCIY